MPQETDDKLTDLAQRCERQRRWFFARQPQSIGKVLGQVVLKKRYACRETTDQLDEVWAAIVGPAMASRCQAVGIRRGKLEVIVAHSAVVQELTFDERRITLALCTAMPNVRIDGVRYRVGPIKAARTS